MGGEDVSKSSMEAAQNESAINLSALDKDVSKTRSFEALAERHT